MQLRDQPLHLDLDLLITNGPSAVGQRRRKGSKR
jgi:hypothetical protein